MDHFERELTRMMRDAREPAPFEQRHQDRLRSGVRARRRARAVQRAAGSVLAVAALGVGLSLLPRDPVETRPQAPLPRPVMSPSAPGPTPARSPDPPPSSTAAPPEAGAETSEPPTSPPSPSMGTESSYPPPTRTSPPPDNGTSSNAATALSTPTVPESASVSADRTDGG